jgi:hypothetical protein
LILKMIEEIKQMKIVGPRITKRDEDNIVLDLLKL